MNNMKLTFLVYVALLSSRTRYLQVNGNEITTAVSTDNGTVYECNFKNLTICKMQIDVGSVGLYWSSTKSNANPPIRDKSDPEGIFLMFQSSKINSGVHSSMAKTPEFLLPTGKGTLSFKYYLWDINDPLQHEFPKLKIFSCGNYTRAIWKRTGDKIDQWIQANIYISCREKFKVR
ncbi:uncharacterized protein LOC117122468 [Anneissia japonica]|uniref:uncharacterized protein LOC117122468 n=1 Tax=Anneissia japonica TaxID=1529436 RepID=UPI001425B376|nr:uncharacterized protein LOC117122468 [Anneissia japonica]